MKKAERLIVYSIAIIATIYGIWAHGKLQLIYRINRENPSFYMPSTMRGKGSGLRQLCLALGELELTGRLKDPYLSEGTRSLLIARLGDNIKFYLNSKWMFSELENQRISLIDAIKAEIDVLSHERSMLEKNSSYNWYDDPVYKSMMEKSISLRSKASMQIYSIMEKI